MVLPFDQKEARKCNKCLFKKLTNKKKKITKHTPKVDTPLICTLGAFIIVWHLCTLLILSDWEWASGLCVA